MADVARLRIVYEGDTSAWDKAHARVKKETQAFSKDASKAGKVKIEADTSDFDASISKSSAHVKDFGKVTKNVDVNVDKDGRALAAVQKLGGGFGELSSSIKQFKTVAAATTLAPGLVAGIGGLPALATAAAGAVGQLGIALGQGLAGGAAIGGTAVYGAAGALKAYNAVIQRTISDSRAAYEATHEAAVKQLEHQRNTILNTKASVAFNEQLNRSAIALTKVEAKIGSRVFPMFTKEIQAWTNILPKFQGDIVNTSGALAKMATNFSRFVRTSNGGQNLRRTIDFINQSAVNAGGTLQHLGRAGFRVFQLLIPPALKLQRQIVSLAGAVDTWTQKSQNMRRVSGIIDLLQHRFYQLVHVVRDFGAGIIGVFKALNATGGPTRLMNGLEGLAAGFRHIMSDSGRGQQAIQRFMGYSQPALNQTWKLVKTVVVQFGLLANNVAKAGQSGGKMGTLAKVIKGIRESVKPLRQMFQNTFIALGPVLAKLIPEAAKFLSVFLGSSGPLKAFLSAVTGILRVFNRLPNGVKTAVVNLIALKTILGGMGVGAFAGSIGRLATQMYTLRTAANAAKKSQIALAVSQGRVAEGAAASGAATAAAGGKFARLGGVVRAAGTAFLTLGRFLLGPWGLAIAGVVSGAILVWRNWDRITKAIRPATQAFRQVWGAIKPLLGALGHALVGALKAAAHGFLSAIVPGKRLGGQVKVLAGGLGGLAKKAIPPVTRALQGLTNFIQSHQGAFRMLGKIVGTVLVAAFRGWWAVQRAGFAVIKASIRFIGNLINAGKSLIKAWRNLTQSTSANNKAMGRSIRNFVSGAFKTITNFGRDAYNFWKNKIWQPMANFLMDRARGMLKTLSNWKSSAVRWVSSLVGAVLKPWQGKIWQPMANFVVERAKGILNTLGNWKSAAGRWVKSLWSAVAKPFGKVFQSMADKVMDIKAGILNTLDNLVSGVSNAWNKMGNYTNKILSALGLKEDKSPIPQPAFGTTTASNPHGPGTGMARGGLLDPKTQQMATGGIADRPRVIYGEAGKEAYVTLSRYTEESAHALKVANDTWAKKGWLDRAQRRHHGDHDEDMSRRHKQPDTRPASAKRKRPGGGWGQGYTVSPITHHKWAPEITERVHAIARATGTAPNTYPGHGEPGGSSELYTADFWGPGGRGDPIAKSAGYKTADLALSQYNHDPGVLYIIRQGRYWRDGHWSGNTYGDPHYDHTHISWDSPGGAQASGGTSSPVPNPKQQKFEEMWSNSIGSWMKKFVPFMSGRTQYHRGSGAGTVRGSEAIYNWIDEKIPDMIGGSGTGSMDNFTGSGMELMRKSLEKYNLPADWANSSKLWQIATWESGTTPSDVHFEPNGPKFMAPWGIINPNRYGVTPSSPSFERFALGPRYVKDQYGTPDKAYAFHKAHNWYGRGGIHAGGKGMNLNLPKRIQNAFHAVADTLKGLASKVPGLKHIERGRGRITDGITGIAGEAGREAIVPLDRRTPEGMHALREANRRHGRGPGGAHSVGYFGNRHPLGTTLGGGVPRAHRGHGGHGIVHGDHSTDSGGGFGHHAAGEIAQAAHHHVPKRPSGGGATHGRGHGQGHGNQNLTAEQILDKIEKHLHDLKKNGITLADKEALLAMADRYQGSPQGHRRFDSNMNRFAKRELKKTGAK